jgi:AmiR/NasT family two-component response regulator
MGILMAAGLLTQQQAFDQLARASQNLNRKLSEIANEIAATGELPAFNRKHLRVTR